VTQLYIAVAIFLAGLAAGGTGAWKVQAWRHDAAELAAKKAADQKEANWRADAETIEEVQSNEVDRLNAEHLAALRRVRNRYAVPAAAGSSQPAASAPILLESGAAAVAGLEADAERVRIDYAACRAWVEAVRR
jgi:hypothetical protein